MNSLAKGRVAADYAVGFAKRACDKIKPVHQAFAFRDTATAWTVRAKGTLLIEVSHCIVFFSKVANCSDVVVHRIITFECDALWAIHQLCGQQFFEVFKIVMAPNLTFCLGTTDAFDH